VFDTNNDNFINDSEFIEGMIKMFTGSYEKLSNLIFDIYDFDEDGKICREDIRIILSYLPLKIMDTALKKKKKGHKLNL
jgi:Ca2+-binding EF-hand superfamily protein